MLNAFFIKMYLLCLSYLWLCWVFVAASGPSAAASEGATLQLAVLGLCCCIWASAAASEGATLQLQCAGFSLQRLLLLQSTGSRHTGFHSCCTWVQQLWPMGVVTSPHVGCSRIRDQTHVSCIGRQILYH